jgi:hypothetical protein
MNIFKDEYTHTPLKPFSSFNKCCSHDNGTAGVETCQVMCFLNLIFNCNCTLNKSYKMVLMY